MIYFDDSLQLFHAYNNGISIVLWVREDVHGLKEIQMPTRRQPFIRRTSGHALPLIPSGRCCPMPFPRTDAATFGRAC